MAPEVAKVKIRSTPGPSGAPAIFEFGNVGGDPNEVCFVPEVDIADSGYCPKIDVWSSGVVLYTCLTGKLPFCNELEIIESDYKRGPLQHCSEEARDLLAGLLTKDPEERLSLEECLEHPWFGCSADDGCTVDYDALEA